MQTHEKLVVDEIEIKQDIIKVASNDLFDVEEQMQTHEKLVVDAKSKAEGYRKRRILLNNPQCSYLEELTNPNSMLLRNKQREREAHYQFLDELVEENARNPLPVRVGLDGAAMAV